MKDLKYYRDQIDEIDAQLVDLFEKRMEVVLKVAEYKKANNIPVYHEGREKEVIEKNTNRLKNKEFKESLSKFFTYLMNLSKEEQKKRM
ncbi:MAG: chorismate mutase [Tissierellia bacterium]|mgnify:CR=1 FL=1|nr:chorismate mutase [Tissierellia bacterium]